MGAIDKIVIVGGGLAGAKAAETLRKKGYAGALDVVAAERHVPYERPPLSKDYLAGKKPFDDAIVNAGDWYAEHHVTLREGVRASAIDRNARTVSLDDGTTLPYDKLVLATGSVVRHLPVEGADAPNVHYLRTVEDSDAIKREFGEGRRLVIVGGGWIGLEVAASARAAATTVTLLERGSLPLEKIVGAQIAQVFADLHRSRGVDVRTEASVAAIEVSDGRATGVRLQSGEVIEADAIVVGIGVEPAIELAEAAGLSTDNGVLVDDRLRTSDPDIFAIGDIANQEHPTLKRRIRVEHWATARRQGVAVASIVLGEGAPYAEVPYFFTDQYELGSEYIGFTDADVDYRVVVRGDLHGLKFVAFWLDDASRVHAAMHVNEWDAMKQIKPLVVAQQVVDADKLADESVPYDQV